MKYRMFSAGVLTVLVGWGVARAADENTPPPASQPAPTEPADPNEPDEPDERNWYVRPKAAATAREPEPPGFYVRPLSESGIPGTEDLSWLDFGIEQRTRFEMREDNFRRALSDDERFLMRTRAYLGVREILDPLRFGIEFQDSRQFGTEVPELTRDVNEADLLQAFGELYFKDALGKNRPLRFQAGRMSFDYVDRRLVARNRFRNTTNAFDGFRVQFGQLSNDWQFDFFAVQPVIRRRRKFDRPDEERWFYGIVPAWRRWSEIITLEPYYFILDEDRKDRDRDDLELHTLGLHAFGPIRESGFDYDVDVAFQFGESGERDIRAFASHGEIGYSVPHPWKPRVAVWMNYASGDRNPGDSSDGRFNSMFGASKTMYSFQNLFPWRNMINPTLQISARPTKKLQLAGYYRAFWLASDNDAFIRAGFVAPAGNRGDFVGQEIDLQVKYQFNRRIGVEIGYAHFLPGSFTSQAGGNVIDDADFFYVQTVLRF